MNRLFYPLCCLLVIISQPLLTAQDCCPIYVKRGQEAFNKPDYSKALEIWQSAKKECSDLQKCPELNNLITKAKNAISDQKAQEEAKRRAVEEERLRNRDSDGDGIRDLDDDCRSERGPKSTNGCPDSDEDGVPDHKDECPKTKGLGSASGCPDSDGDGILDKDDKCPEKRGNRDTRGCPDGDSDGVADDDDRCPEQAGDPANNGCPPDRDSDGVPDINDQCPDTLGHASANGCPDRDEDGVVDSADKCPDEKGGIETNGCPDQDSDGIPDGDDDCPYTKGAKKSGGCPDYDSDGISDYKDLCPTKDGYSSREGCPEYGSGLYVALDFSELAEFMALILEPTPLFVEEEMGGLYLKFGLGYGTGGIAIPLGVGLGFELSNRLGLFTNIDTTPLISLEGDGFYLPTHLNIGFSYAPLSYPLYLRLNLRPMGFNPDFQFFSGLTLGAGIRLGEY